MLKNVLYKCIFYNQSTFVPCRSILYNAMVAIEMVHFMKFKTKNNDRVVALKLDISKVYERFDQLCLKEVIVKNRIFSPMDPMDHDVRR